MASRAAQHEEMEYGVHIPRIADRIERGAGNITHPFGYNPVAGEGRDGKELLEYHQYRQSHENIANSFHMTMFFHLSETKGGTCDGTQPDETEQYPSPGSVFSQGYENDRGEAARYVPVDGGVVPMPEAPLPRVVVLHGVVERGSDVRTSHAEKIEPYTEYSPRIMCLVAFYQKQSPYNYSHNDAYAVRDRIDGLFAPTVEQSVPFLLFV